MDRKTNQMRSIERTHGHPIEWVIVDALNRHTSYRRAAESLGVPAATLYVWMARLGIRVETRKFARVV